MRGRSSLKEKEGEGGGRRHACSIYTRMLEGRRKLLKCRMKKTFYSENQRQSSLLIKEGPRQRKNDASKGELVVRITTLSQIILIATCGMGEAHGFQGLKQHLLSASISPKKKYNGACQ